MNRSALLCFLLASCGGATSDPGPGPGTTSDGSVRGVFESIDGTGHAVGWALAPAWGSHPLETAVFCDGDSETGTLIYTVRANQERDDVATATGIPGKHGFTFDIPDNLEDGKEHTLHVYGLGANGVRE